MKSKRLLGALLLMYAVILVTVVLSIMLIMDNEYGDYAIVIPEPVDVDIIIPSVTDYNVVSQEYTEVESDVELDYVIEIPEIEITNHRGVKVRTSPVYVNVTQLLDSYNRVGDSTVEWDNKDRISVLNTLWEFLVLQQGIDPIYASAIMGNVAIEGEFGEEQGTNKILSSIEDANNILSNSKGYGICQWTYKTRKQDLLNYYNTVYEITEDWGTTLIIAECCMILEECKAMKLFDDIYYCSSNNLEHATGVIAVEYEGYRNSKKQWSKTNGEYYLVSTLGSGEERLDYAENVYNHYTKSESLYDYSGNSITVASAVY